MLIITAFLPVVAENLPKGVGSFRYFWAPLWLISLLLFKGKETLSNFVILNFLIYGISLFILFSLVWNNIDLRSRTSLIEEFYWMITVVSVLYYYIFSKDIHGLILIIKLIFIFIGITSVITIVVSYINPLYARLLTQSSSGFYNTAEGNYFLRMGAAQYSFGQSLICIFPILIFFYKIIEKSLILKWVIITYLILMFYTIIRMQFFANILLSLILILISFLGGKRIKLSVFIVCMFLGITFLIPKSYYSDLLISFSYYFDAGSENFNKIKDLSEFISEPDESGETASRLSRYPVLFNVFVKNPIFGDAHATNPDNDETGYHLHWMNKLATTGLCGVLLFFLPHFIFIKNWVKRFSKEYAFFAAISYLGFFGLGLMKAIAGKEIWFIYFFIIPGMYYLTCQYKENEKVELNKLLKL